MARVLDPNDVLKQVLAENPGFGSVINPKNTEVRFASPERMKAVSQAYGGKLPGSLEYWPSDETGLPNLPHPVGGGKNVIEVYDPGLQDSLALKNAIYGDLMHGMSRDATWKNMRDEFKVNFTPEETERIKSGQSWWDDARGGNEIATYDSYIRGWLNDPSARRGQEESGGTMYSPKQIKILEDMGNYLKTGDRSGWFKRNYRSIK